MVICRGGGSTYLTKKKEDESMYICDKQTIRTAIAIGMRKIKKCARRNSRLIT